MARYVKYAEIMELAYSITDRMEHLNIIGVATTVAGCGLGKNGVRQIASSSASEEVLTTVVARKPGRGEG